MATKVITGKTRFSFCNIFEPKEPQGGGDPKYSVTLLIPKSDTATISKIKSQNTFVFARSRTRIPFPSGTMGAMGTLVKAMALQTGTTAHKHAIHRQFSMPKSLKSKVETSTTPTTPQQ